MTAPRLAVRLCLALALAAAGRAAHARTEPFDPLGAARVDQRPGALIPLDAAFRDQAGRAVTLRQLAGPGPLLIVPVQHRCPNLCGLTLDGLRAAIAGQSYRPGRSFAIVALGLDPREDAAAAAVSEQRLAGAAAAPGVHAVVGSAAQIGRVTQALGYRYAWDPRTRQYAHIAAAAVLTPGGRLARWIDGVAPTPLDLHLALTDAGRGRLGGVGDRLQLLCFHYDPQTGRYDNLVLAILRGVGLTTAAGLALLVGGLAWRGRAREPRS